jgi:hypothetical protein
MAVSEALSGAVQAGLATEAVTLRSAEYHDRLREFQRRERAA